MSLSRQFGQALRETIAPMRQPRIVRTPIPRLIVPAIRSIQVPTFGLATLFRFPSALLPPTVDISQNFLFRLEDILIEDVPVRLQVGLPGDVPLSLAEPRVMQLARLVLGVPSIGQDLAFALAELCERPRISDNLFVPLADSSTRGKAYGDAPVKGTAQSGLFPEQEPSQGSQFRKAYERTKSPNAISEATTHKLSIWDLIYPLLLPPLNLQFTPQLDVLQKLRPYQRDGITFLVTNREALLADEMGTGKTVMALVALRILFRKGAAKRALIVCPVGVLRVWQDHLEDWASELEFTVVRGSREVRKRDWECPAHVYVATYDTLAGDFLTLIKKNTAMTCSKCGKTSRFRTKVHLNGPDDLGNLECPHCGQKLDELPVKEALVDESILNSFDVVILDEAQYIKNPKTDRSRAVRTLDSKYRWALTGTPIENSLEDLKSLFDFLKPGYLHVAGSNRDAIREMSKPYFLRRLKKDVLSDLPPKMKQESWLELDDHQREEYDTALGNGRSELSALGDKATKVHIFSLITKLKRICNFSSQFETSPKAEAMLDLVDEVQKNGQKVIIFTQWADRYGVETLRRLLSPWGVEVLVGGMSDGDRQLAIERFKKDPGKAVLLATVRTGGVGLTLTEANYVIHFDHWWNPAVMWQAEDRVHRPGQMRGVNIYSFWIQNTIEERIFSKLREKGLLFEEVINGLSEEKIESVITTEEWLEILGVPGPSGQKARARQEYARASRSLSETLEELATLDPFEFEEIVKAVFQRLGFSGVRTTKRSHDGGIDILGQRDSLGGAEKFVAQCKRVERAGVEVARELLGAIAADQEVAKGYLVTSGLVTPECRAFCEKDGRLAVIEGPLLARYINDFDVPLSHA
ncbi:MAG TPA: SNF2-related protein [Candidatus Acidoferrum sp.]|nr:SNF2-related protein [Candidatus Acidoferrum sp.]